MKRDPSANQMIEVYEDDIIDWEEMDMNYETMEDVLIEKNCNKDDDENIIIENDKNDITLK